MNKLFILGFGLVILLSACKKEVLSDKNVQLSLELEQVNTSIETYSTSLKSISFQEARTQWNRYGDSCTISKTFMLECTMENDLVFNLNFYFTKQMEASKNIVFVDAENENDTNGNEWHYLSPKLEASNFYPELDAKRIEFGNNVFWTEEGPDASLANQINFESIKQKKLNGESKNWLCISFEGIANGWFDPEGQWTESYQINGEFIGFIEDLDF